MNTHRVAWERTPAASSSRVKLCLTQLNMHHSSFDGLSFKWREEERFVDRVQSCLWVWTKTHTAWLEQFSIWCSNVIKSWEARAKSWSSSVSGFHSSLDILDHGRRDFLPANQKCCRVIKVWLLPVHVQWGWGQGSSTSPTPNSEHHFFIDLS